MQVQRIVLGFFFFNDTATTEIYTNLNTLSLHDALPISAARPPSAPCQAFTFWPRSVTRSEEHTSELQSHSEISYAVFCLKKKNTDQGRLARPGRLRQDHPVHRAVRLVQHPADHPGRHAGVPDRRRSRFFFNDTATTEIYTNLNTLSLHDALPI